MGYSEPIDEDGELKEEDVFNEVLKWC